MNLRLRDTYFLRQADVVVGTLG